MKTPFSPLNQFLERIREMFFPLGCALCGKSLHEKLKFPANKKYSGAFYGLCFSCHELLTIPTAERDRCLCCGQPLVSEIETCLPCRNGEKRSFDRIISLFPYMGKYQKILASYKFGKRLSLGNFFAEKLWQGVKMFEDISLGEYAWVPVPAKPGKIKHKGWDQIDYLAKLLKLGMPESSTGDKSAAVSRCLKRLPSISQKELNRENRLQNLKGRIIIDKTGSSGVVPKTAVLFDDVYTTGATMDVCAAALKSGGAEKVYGICLCYD